MAVCKLTKNFEIADCAGLPAGGVTGRVYLFDFDDWLSGTPDRAEDGTITGLTLADEAKGVRYALPVDSPMPSNEPVRNAGGLNGFKHTLEMYIPKVTQALRKEFVGLNNFGRCVAVVIKDSDQVANMYGSDSGLVMTSFIESPADGAVGGGAKVILASPENGMENYSAVTFRAEPAEGKNAREATLVVLDKLISGETIS